MMLVTRSVVILASVAAVALTAVVAGAAVLTATGRAPDADAGPDCARAPDACQNGPGRAGERRSIPGSGPGNRRRRGRKAGLGDRGAG